MLLYVKVFVPARTNLLPSFSMITLVEDVVDHSLKQSLEKSKVGSIHTECTQILATEEYGGVIAVKYRYLLL